MYRDIKAARDKAKQRCLHEINTQVDTFNSKIQKDLGQLANLQKNIQYKNMDIIEAEKEARRKRIAIKNIRQKLDSVMAM